LWEQISCRLAQRSVVLYPTVMKGSGRFVDLVVLVNEPMRTTPGDGNRCGVERQVVGAHFIPLGGGSLAIVESESADVYASSFLPTIFNCQSHSM
jgi:hypothetical protein